MISKLKKNDAEPLFKAWDDLFHGLGKLKGYKVMLNINENIKYVQQPQMSTLPCAKTARGTAQREMKS